MLTVTCFAACSPETATPPDVGQRRSNLSAAKRLERAEGIRDAAALAGLHNGLLLAGIAEAETGLAHCWSEATWACQGPASVDCDGGPLISGAGDGPCEILQGGLGLFQFDAGTHSETLAREGDRILTIEGSTLAAIDFVSEMVIRSRYIENVDTRDEAIAWMNTVRPWSSGWDLWIKTVTHYYNGCNPDWCDVYEDRYDGYSAAGERMLIQMGAETWFARAPGCVPISAAAEPTIIDDEDACFGAGGDPMFWRNEPAGFGDDLLWTTATDEAKTANYAIWGLSFDAAGDYELEVFIDGVYAESVQADYDIEHAGASQSVVVDQTQSLGFVSLGIFYFEADQRYMVRIGDDTGEPSWQERALVVDALRVTLVERDDPGSGAAGSGAAGSGGAGSGGTGSGGAGSGGTGSDDAFAGAGGRDDERRYPGAVLGSRFASDPSDEGGCAIRAPGASRDRAAPWAALGALALGMLAAARRRRQIPLPDGANHGLLESK